MPYPENFASEDDVSNSELFRTRPLCLRDSLFPVKSILRDAGSVSRTSRTLHELTRASSVPAFRIAERRSSI